MKEYLFNLNSAVLVQLTDLGYQLLAERHNYYIGRIPNWEYRTPDYYKAQADKAGYTCMQAWEFIEKFGPSTGLLKPQHYHLNIKIKANNLTLVK